MIISETTITGELIKTLPWGSEKRVMVNCDMCKKEYTVIYHNYTESQKKREWPLTTYCKYCTAKAGAPKMKGRTPPNKGKKFPERCGESSPTWNGGTYIDANGYRMKYVGNQKQSPTDTGWSSYRKEHILVMEEYLGKSVSTPEVIHHINGIKTDNRIDNLDIFSSDKTHRECHISLEKLAMQLVQLEIIMYDKTSQKYYMADIKLRELLEHLEEDNQQPTRTRNRSKGSETRLNDPARIMKAQERGAPIGDEIVRTANITKEIAEVEDKELLR